MNMNRYIRPQLSATADCLADPLMEVDLWLDSLREILDGVSPSGAAHDAYDLLALLGKLERVRPEIIQDLRGDAIVQKARDLLARNATQLVEEALKIPHVQGWLEQAELLKISYEGQLINADEQYSLAEKVLFDLDDAELVLVMARRLGRDDEELSRGLANCREWIRQQADFFVPVSMRVQSVGQTLRLDLEVVDPALVQTADKFIWILNALEEAEAIWQFKGQPPIPMLDIRAMVRSFGASLAQIIPFRDLLANRERPAVAAAQVGGVAPIDRSYVWRSPDQQFWAELRIPYLEQNEGDEVFSLAFYRVDNDEPAIELGGESVTLAGATASIDGTGVARFARKAIADGQTQLAVGQNGEKWLPEIL